MPGLMQFPVLKETQLMCEVQAIVEVRDFVTAVVAHKVHLDTAMSGEFIRRPSGGN